MALRPCLLAGLHSAPKISLVSTAEGINAEMYLGGVSALVHFQTLHITLVERLLRRSQSELLWYLSVNALSAHSTKSGV